MAGPDSPNHSVGAERPPFTEPYPSQPIPRQPAYTSPSATTAARTSGGYPGPLPPPVWHPKRQRRRLVIGIAVTLVLVAAMTSAVVYGALHSGATGGAISDATAKTAIQGYLDALEQRDTQTIARNTLCGIYDAVRDKRSDEALARLSSDAFSKQFAQAEVTSIDQIVYWSPYQAHVLFSMRVVPATGSPARDVQGLAQLLVQRRQLLVCSYVLHTAGTY